MAPALKFLHFDVIKVAFDRPTGYRTGTFEINVEHVPDVDSSDPSKFSCTIIVTINSKDQPFTLQVQSVGSFEIVGDNVPANVRDNFLLISAPSIVYPYVRAFISNMVLQGGMAPIVIPPMNFAIRLDGGAKVEQTK